MKRFVMAGLLVAVVGVGAGNAMADTNVSGHVDVGNGAATADVNYTEPHEGTWGTTDVEVPTPAGTVYEHGESTQSGGGGLVCGVTGATC